MARLVLIDQSIAFGLPLADLLDLEVFRATGFAALEPLTPLLRLMVGLSCFLIALERDSQELKLVAPLKDSNPVSLGYEPSALTCHMLWGF